MNFITISTMITTLMITIDSRTSHYLNGLNVRSDKSAIHDVIY